MNDLQNAENALNELIEEENHLRRLHNVFGQGDGPAVLEWLLEYCGYWRGTVHSEKEVGKLDVARFLFNQIAMADPEVTYQLISRRRNEAEQTRQRDRQAAEARLKELKA